MTGAKSLTETDFVTDHLKFARYYNSGLEENSANLGVGWRHSYSSHLLFEAFYTLIGSDGNSVQFKFVATGVYRSASRPGLLLQVAGNLAQIAYEGGRKEIYELADMPNAGSDFFRLVEIYEPSIPDRPIVLEYDPLTATLTSVTDQFGRALQFQYASGTNITAIILPDGEDIQFSYNSDDSLDQVTYQDNFTREYLYEDATLPHHVTGITDENSVRYATYDYDTYGRVTLSEHAGSAGSVTLNYVAAGSTQVTTPSGDVRTYDFDQGSATFEVDGFDDGNGAVAYVRNSDGWSTQVTDARGVVTQYGYDTYHKTQQIDAVGTSDERTIAFGWDNILNRRTSIDEPGALTSFVYDSEGRLLTKTIEDEATNAERVWTYTYYDGTAQPAEIGRLETVDGPRTDVTDVTTYGYYTSDDAGGLYKAGDLHTMVNALGHVTEYLEYDGNGRPTKIEDANNVVTTISYHPRGWIATRTTDGKTTVHTYDPAGNLSRITQPDGSYIDYEYDDAHRLTALEDNFGNRIAYTLDAAGNRTSEDIRDDLGVLARQLDRQYDQLNHLETLIDGNLDETDYGYDANGKRTSTLDANLNITSFEYDNLNRMEKTIDAILGETLMDYDERDNLISVTDPVGNETQYVYDGLDNQTQLTSPDTGTTDFEYDDAGNRTAATDARGVRVEYAYDALSRLTDITYPNSILDVSFTYDTGTNGIGRLTGMTDAAGSVAYTYDARGNLISETRTLGIDQYVTTYDYNDADRLIQIGYPSGMVIDYTLDSAGRVVTVEQTVDSVTETLASGVTYEPFGPISGFTYGNGLTYSASYDVDYELDQLQSGTDLDWLLGYDPVGNILNITDQATPIHDQVFTYDDLYRLDTAQGTYSSEDYDYDDNGNRTRYQSGVIDDSYTYTSQTNRLLTQGGWTFTRDAAGNRTGKLDSGGFGSLYEYGDHNRLSEVTDRDGSGDTVVEQLVYDGKGQRVTKIGSSSTINFVYGLSGELLGEYPAGNPDEWTEYVFLNGHPIAVHRKAVEPVQPPPVELILDNGDAGTSSSGSWQIKTSAQDFGANYRYANTAAGTSYRWTAAPPGSTYDVYAWWVDHNNQSANVTYTIRYGSGATSNVVKSHKTGGGQWQYLGSYTSVDGNDYVQVTSSANKYVADAIRWVHTPDPVVALNVTTNFVHFDHLGTPRQVSDENQTVIWRWDSRPFGDSVPVEDPDGNSITYTLNLRFPGQYFDEESGLNYNYFRDYDPSIGRYIESDPIGLDGGLNSYLYADANPIRYIDPRGQVTEAALGSCVLGGPFNPVCDVAVIINVCKWTVIIGASIMLSGDSCDGDSCPANAEEEDEEKKKKSCQALKDSILSTCYGLTGRKQMACWEAANTAYRQCLGFE